MFNKKTFYAMILAMFVAACASQSSLPAARLAQQSEKLGTKWGDEVQSSVTTVNLKRLANQPIDENILHYAAKNFNGRALNSIALLNGKVALSVQDDNGARLPLFRENGAYYLRGQSGQAYQLVYQNTSAQTYEIVASVDGLDVLNGSRASRYNTGYVLYPHSRLVIEGFRKNENAVASFIFSQPENAYAAHSDNGSVQNVGVIGTAIFELRNPQNPANPFPADNHYAPPPK